MRVLLIAPYYDKSSVGESWSTYKWVEGISQRHETTVLTTHKESWKPEDSPTEAHQVINWRDPSLPNYLEMFNRGAKPTYFLFYRRAKNWIKDYLSTGETFDIAHQINPLALRYPSPLSHFDIPYLIGPLAGSLPTPLALRKRKTSEPSYRKFRAIDSFRLRYDPWLKNAYRNAACVLGVAPYVKELLSHCSIKRIEYMSETGVEKVTDTPKSFDPSKEKLRLLFVGRIIATKGILDAIEAVAKVKNRIAVEFNILGDGELLQECRKRVVELGLEPIVHFHGRVSRQEVGLWYERSHVFLFPSYREPSGNVVLEALGAGLPVITTTEGGPGYVVQESCGQRIDPDLPSAFAQGIAGAIERFLYESAEVARQSQAALVRVEEIGRWKNKIDRLMRFYTQLSRGRATMPLEAEKQSL
jgi:glycosyltransferase involved in cell wall biosynthesis